MTYMNNKDGITVKDLRSVLANLPDDAKVVIPGMEGAHELTTIQAGYMMKIDGLPAWEGNIDSPSQAAYAEMYYGATPRDPELYAVFGTTEKKLPQTQEETITRYKESKEHIAETEKQNATATRGVGIINKKEAAAIAEYARDLESENGYIFGEKNKEQATAVSVKKEAIEWAGYTIARDIARQNNIPLGRINPEQTSRNERVVKRVEGVRDEIKDEVKNGYVSIENFSNKDRVGFLGFFDNESAARWAGLAIARDELHREGYELNNLTVEDAALYPEIGEKLRHEVVSNLQAIGVERQPEDFKKAFDAIETVIKRPSEEKAAEVSR